MALTTFPSVYSGLDTPESGTSQTETHRVPTTAPYTILLSRIPRCTATATSVLNNPYTTITALRGECSVTLNGAAATIIDGQTPTASGQVALQIQAGGQYEFSPLVIFHSSDAGKTAVFSYFGFMSNADSRYLTNLQAAVTRAEELPPCAILSLATYDSGVFGRGTADGTSVFLTGMRGAVGTDSHGKLTFTGALVSLASGDTQVSAFTDVDGYKSISLYLQDVDGILTPVIAESAEVATKPTTPTVTTASGWLCGAVIVHGDGTGNAGGILAIAQSDCFSLWDVSGGGLWSQIQGKPDFDALYAAADHDHDADYAALGHNHDTAYSALAHAHTFAAITEKPSVYPADPHINQRHFLTFTFPGTLTVGQYDLQGLPMSLTAGAWLVLAHIFCTDPGGTGNIRFSLSAQITSQGTGWNVCTGTPSPLSQAAAEQPDIFYNIVNMAHAVPPTFTTPALCGSDLLFYGGVMFKMAVEETVTGAADAVVVLEFYADFEDFWAYEEFV